jgi:hypothetical protein
MHLAISETYDILDVDMISPQVRLTCTAIAVACGVVGIELLRPMMTSLSGSALDEGFD